MTVLQSTATHIPTVTGGDRLRMALRDAGIGAQELADYLDVSRNTVSRWLNDHVTPDRRTLIVCAMRTGVPLEWLETGRTPAGEPGSGGLRARRDSNPQPSDP